jgi:Domain of unknown function (DUF222)
VLTKSVALQLARWTRAIPAEYRREAEEIVVAAARAGADLRSLVRTISYFVIVSTLAAICAEIRYRTARPDPEDENDRHLDRGVSFDTTIDGAGVIRGDLTPECAAMVQAVLDALSAPAGGGDLRTWPQRYHDALEEAMRWLQKCVVICHMTMGVHISRKPTVGLGKRAPGWRHSSPGSRSSALAMQAADRFHLGQNLGQAAEKTVNAHRAQLGEPAAGRARSRWRWCSQRRRRRSSPECACTTSQSSNYGPGAVQSSDQPKARTAPGHRAQVR